MLTYCCGEQTQESSLKATLKAVRVERDNGETLGFKSRRAAIGWLWVLIKVYGPQLIKSTHGPCSKTNSTYVAYKWH